MCRSWLAGALLSIVAGAACHGASAGVDDGQSELADGSSVAGSDDAAGPATRGAVEFADALSALDARIGELKFLHARDASWSSLAAVGESELERGRLTGRMQDYAQAGATLRAAQALAPEGGGPTLSLAAYALAIHERDQAADLLAAFDARPGRTKAQQRTANALHVELLRASGDLRAARALALDRLEHRRSFDALTRLAVVEVQMGEDQQARAHFEDALASYHGDDPRPRAWIHVQLGAMDLESGRLDQADAALKRADGELAGWWLVKEHQAEVLALRGDAPAAREAYAGVLRLNDSGEFYDALAALEPDASARARLIALARSRHEQAIAALPSAGAGHALDHHLAFNPDTEAVLQLARAQAAKRPDADALLKLAEAATAAGAFDEAQRTLARADASGVAPRRVQDLRLALSTQQTKADAQKVGAQVEGQP